VVILIASSLFLFASQHGLDLLLQLQEQAAGHQKADLAEHKGSMFALRTLFAFRKICNLLIG
jgi:hypothetical protein